MATCVTASLLWVASAFLGIEYGWSSGTTIRVVALTQGALAITDDPVPAVYLSGTGAHEDSVTRPGRLRDIASNPWTIALHVPSFPWLVWRPVVYSVGEHGGEITYLPLWPAIAVLAFPTLWLFWLDHRRRIRPGHCQCGYNLRGNVSGRCPECGGATGGAATDFTAENAGSAEKSHE